MPRQLDILALEPFYGGARRVMLETLLQNSRHRWTLLRLPPRRIERRLAVAARWFAEQLTRHWVGPVDILFTSEAMNLADLLRLVPALARIPSAVYFHDNQLPAENQPLQSTVGAVNLTTATAATEVWFNSRFHMRRFMAKAASLVGRVPELSGLNPLPGITAKSHVMSPPIDLMAIRKVAFEENIVRDPKTLFVDTRDADVRLLNSAFQALRRRGRKYQLLTVGPVEGLDSELPRRTISELDEVGQVRALHQAGIHVSARGEAACDHHAVRALSAGCWPILPRAGVYPELLPRQLHSHCLYDVTASDKLTNRIEDVWMVEQPRGYEEELFSILGQFDAADASRAIDKRLEALVDIGIKN